MKKTVIRQLLLTLFCLGFPLIVVCQGLKFAFVTDTHIGSHTAAEDLRRTVRDINENGTLQFVVLTGDITDFGADEELTLARQILDSLNKPWFIIPGNHDANWSESGSNTFRRVFGSETFSFIKGGYLFAATSSGPNMRMGPGQIPRENVVWLDSVLNHMPDPKMPVIYLNHYPQDSSQNNWYEALDLLKKRNVQLILCGHGHTNHFYNFDGIPGVMGRSNLRAKDSIGGYNIVTIEDGTAIFEERRPIVKMQKKWLSVDLADHHFDRDTTHYFRPSYAVNRQFSSIRVRWQYQDKSDVGAGAARGKKLIVTANTNGEVYALGEGDGSLKWSFKTGGKIYSTPTISKQYVVVGSSDAHIYCLSLLSGKLVWRFAALKAVLGSPVIKNNIVYIGSSDGHFRALDLRTGELVWDFDQVSGFVVDKPLIYRGKIFFGCWSNDFYALDLKTGKLQWKWKSGSSNRMYSPAACYPVGAKGRVFIVAPDRYMTSFEASTGKVIWRKQTREQRVRESIGISADRSIVYAKTMDGQILGISTTADSMKVSWTSTLRLPYELTPSAILENRGVVYIPTHSGLAVGLSRKTGRVLWKYKVSNGLLNPPMPFDRNKVILSAMDGKIVCLEYMGKNR